MSTFFSMEEATNSGTLVCDFIDQRKSQILGEWERRIRSLPVTEGLHGRALRDHIPELLESIARVVRSVHTGKPATLGNLPDLHALERLDAGFDLRAAASELATLRDVILEMWEQEAAEAVTAAEIQRLNRAIDDTLARSVDRFARARERTLRALDQVSSVALGTSDLNAFLSKLLTVLLENTEAVDSTAILLKDDGGLLRARAAVGLEEEVAQGFSLPVGVGFSGTVAQKKEPLLLRDAVSDPLVQSPVIKRRGVHALYGVPLIHEDEVIGVAHMGSRTAFEFSEMDKQLFRAMAQRATAVIVQAQLLDRLRASEERLRLAAHASRVGIWELDLTTLTAWRNELHDRAFGYGEMLPEWSFEIFLAHVHEEDRERVRESMQRAMKEQGAFSEEVRVRWPDGTLHWMAVTGQVEKHDSGRPTRMVGTNMDITDRKHREQEDRMRAEFERQLIGVVSHDLRNPLSAILLATAALVRREELDERTLKSVIRIQSSAERATRLVKDLLDFTQARLGGGIRIERRPADLHTLTRSVLEEVEAAYPGREMQVRSQGNGRGEWDPDRLAQVVQNLVTNALKYSPEGTPVQVVTRGEDGQVVLSVHNQGVPIPLERRQHLFEPMQRATADVDKAGRSVGLGLYIVKHIVDAHGGTIEVRSSESEGTTFTVRWPRTSPQT